VSTFYLLPPRPYLGECVASFLQGLFPDLKWDNADLVETLTATAIRHAGIYVVYREELPEGEEPAQSLADGFGAEPGDEVIELRAAERPGAFAVRRWHLGKAA
jgi:hypothetical protein